MFKKSLNHYVKDITSQRGEDGVIEQIFRILNVKKGWCVDIGAGNGKFLSNTWNLINNKHWSAILIEADKYKYQELSKLYKQRSDVVCINKKVGFKDKIIPDKILRITPLPRSFDLLSLDVDGIDYHVWKSIKIYSPKAIVIEFNPTIPLHIDFVNSADPNVSQGSSLLALVKLGNLKNYELIATTAWNAFFVQKKFFNLFKISDNSPKTIHTSREFYTDVYQLFDGTIVVSGCKRLLWHNIKFDLPQFQILPKCLRKNPAYMNSGERFLLSIYRFYRQIFFDPNFFDFFQRGLKYVWRNII